MAKKKAQTIDEKVTVAEIEVSEETATVTPTAVEYTKPKLTPEQIKKLRQDVSLPTLRARGII